MKNFNILAKIFIQYVAICGTTIVIFRYADLNSFFNLDPVSTHKKCLKHFLSLEEARKLNNTEQHIAAVNNYWDCHYENLGNTN